MKIRRVDQLRSQTKVFQEHTPPKRLHRKPNHDKNQTFYCVPNPEPTRLLSIPEPVQHTVTKTCTNQPAVQSPTVTQNQNHETSQKTQDPPPRTIKVRDPPSKNHLTKKNHNTVA